MLGLIKKDFLMIKANLKTFLIIFIAFIIMSYNGSYEMTFVLPFLCIMLFISTFSYDDFNNWNAYAISFPCSRKTIVKSKYMASIIITIISSIIGVLVAAVIAGLKGSIDVSETLDSLFSCILAISIIISIMYTMIFKYGSEKGRIFLFLLFAIIAVLGNVFYKYIDFSSLERYLSFFEKNYYVVIPMFSALIICVSYLISKRIYLKKEF